MYPQSFKGMAVHRGVGHWGHLRILPATGFRGSGGFVPFVGVVMMVAVTAPFSVLYTYGLILMLVEAPHRSCICPNITGETPVV